MHAKAVIKDRMTVIAPLVRDKTTLDLGIVDSRRQRHDTKDRLKKKPSSLFRQINQLTPDVLGVDIDEEGVKLLAKQGFNTLHANVSEMDLGKRFQTIVAGEIIEHLPDPGVFLRNMRKHLTDDGCLVLTTPNPFYVKNCWKILRYNRPCVHEEHTCWFEPITLTHLCNLCGLEVYEFYWIQPKLELLKTWPRFLRNYFSHSFMLLTRPKIINS
jgi:SAM-dependent methyltransferase